MVNSTVNNVEHAVLDEMQTWVRIVAEHLKFHRGGLDPSLEQDQIFRTLDMLARRTDLLYAQIFGSNMAAHYDFDTILNTTIAEVTVARNYKVFMFEGIRDCRILSIVPAGLADHVRRETDRFLGILGRVIGEPTPTRQTLGIPDGNKRVQSIPRLLIPSQPPQVRFTDVLEEIMFFSRIHGEHAGHISMAIRPVVQESVRVRAKDFETRLLGNIDRAKAVENSGQGFDRLVTDSHNLAVQFRDFVQELLNGVRTCQVPTGQTNAWPLLIDHILRETLFWIGILELAH